MEVFGKVSDIILSREGTSQSTGNNYQIHTVVVTGSDNICFEVFGTMEHLTKNGIVKGAEGKFLIKADVSFYKDKYYQRLTLDNVRNDFKPIGGTPKPLVENTEASAQVEAAAQAKADAQPKDNGQEPAPTDDLPF